MSNIVDKYDKSDEMIEYNKLLQSESELNYGIIPIIESSLRSEKANLIMEQYDKTDPYDLLKLCLSEKEAKSIIMTYELRNYEFQTKENMDLKEFVQIALNFLNRYQHKAGGFLLHNHQWECHDQSSQKRHTFQMKSNEILFINSLDNKNEEDIETEFFIDLLLEKLNTIATNIEVKHGVYEPDQSRIHYILLSAIDKNKKKKK